MTTLKKLEKICEREVLKLAGEFAGKVSWVRLSDHSLDPPLRRKESGDAITRNIQILAEMKTIETAVKILIGESDTNRNARWKEKLDYYTEKYGEMAYSHLTFIKLPIGESYIQFLLVNRKAESVDVTLYYYHCYPLADNEGYKLEFSMALKDNTPPELQNEYGRQILARFKKIELYDDLKEQKPQELTEAQQEALRDIETRFKMLELD